jgi:ADP-ribose pyrophosphatase YjhB (NUDIX family)
MQKPIEKYCAFCGRPLEDPNAGWPKTCACGEITYRNPLPVVNVIIPVVNDEGRRGVLLIQRGIEPCRGLWALPGGYLELGETWQQGAARELFEETGLVVDPDLISLVDVDMNPKRTQILVFAKGPAYTVKTLPKIARNEEVLDDKILYDPEELAFPPQTKLVKSFLLSDKT